jgi:hypothetical protein
MNSQKKQIIFLRCIIVILIGGILLSRVTISQNGLLSVNGFVPTEETAIKIAEAVWLPIFGDVIYDLTPKAEYCALLNCWKVRGVFPENEMNLGWIPEVFIDKKSGKIVYAGIY